MQTMEESPWLDDDEPTPKRVRALRVLVGAASTGPAFTAVASFFSLRASCTIEIEGDLRAARLEDGAIYCVWHGDLYAYLLVFLREHRLAVMSDPHWRLTPLRMGLRIAGGEPLGVRHDRAPGR